MNRCKKCGAELAEDAKFCSVCGTAAEQEKSAGAQESANGAEPEAQVFGAGTQNEAAATEAQVFGAGAQNEAAATEAQQFGAGTQANGSQQFGAGAQTNGSQQFGAGAQMNGNQQFGNGAQTNGSQQFGAGAQMNGNQQFGNSAQANGSQQFGAGAQFQQAAPKETAAAYYAKQPYMPPADDAQANKGVAVCGYFGLLWIVPLVTTAKHSPFAKFHANQALMVFLTSIATWVAVWLLKLILFALFSWRVYALTRFLSFAAGVFTLILSVVGIVYAAQGKMKELPVIGQFHLIK
ncbi:MAG: zinc-ribbon domain-containing protein [Roseburia sp.]|nr:zinc-ribbon domain-containing protein [Roseburia sp.]